MDALVIDSFDGVPSADEDEQPPKRVPVGPVAAAVKTSCLCINEIAYDVGYRRRSETGRVRGDDRRLKRVLGMVSESRAHGRPSFNTTIDYDLAVRIVRAAGVWPVDADL